MQLIKTSFEPDSHHVDMLLVGKNYHLSTESDGTYVLQAGPDSKKFIFQMSSNRGSLEKEIQADARIYQRLALKPPRFSLYQANYKELPEAIKAALPKPQDDTKTVFFQLSEYTPAYKDKIRYQLASTTAQRGLMQRELIQQTRHKPPPSSVTLTSGNTQSDIHFQAMMGDDYTTYSSFDQKVDAFDQIYQKLNVVMSDAQRKQFAQKLATESHHPSKYVAYHGTTADIGFVMDVVTEFRKQLELQYAEDFEILRLFDDRFSDPASLARFMKSTDDLNDVFRATGMSVNFFLFGSDGKASEATYYYALKNKAQSPPENLLNHFFKRLEIDIDPGIFQSIYERFVKDAGGLTYQFLIDPSCIDQVARPSSLQGRQNPLDTDDKGILTQVSDVLRELRENPTKYSNYIQKLQGRLYLNPDVMHNPDKVIIKSYRANPLSVQQEKHYRGALRKAVSDCIKSLLVAHNKLPPTAFARAKGQPSLHRQMEMIYQDKKIAGHGKPDVRYVIWELIKENDIPALIQLIIDDENIDLNCEYTEVIPGQYNPTLLDLFRGKIAVSVFEALQAHKNKPHIARVLQQLQMYAWYHYVGCGDLTRSKTLYNAVLWRFRPSGKPIPKSTQEIYRESRLKKALKIAVKSKQAETLSWLLEECRLYEVSSPTDLEYSIKQGHHSIVKQLLSAAADNEFTALDFAKYLILARQQKQFEVIGVLLEKLQTMPLELAELVLIQSDSILVYLHEMGREDILEKSPISLEILKADIRCLIPAFLAEGDVERTVAVVISTDTLDLSTSLMISNHDTAACSIQTLLDTISEDATLCVTLFDELLNHKDKAHVANALNELLPTVWFYYVRLGDLEKVNDLFARTESISNREQLYKAIKLAAQYNKIDVFNWLLNQYQELRYNTDSIYQGILSPLAIAVESGHHKIVENILSKDAATQLRIKDFGHLLSVSTTKNDPEMIRILIGKLKIVTKDTSSDSLMEDSFDASDLLLYLVVNGHNDLLRDILQNLDWVLPSLSKVRNILNIAIENRHVDIVTTLLNISADIAKEIIDKNKDCMLSAVKRNNLPIVKLLLLHNVSPNKKDQYERTALMIAAQRGYTKVLTALLDKWDLSDMSEKSSENLDALSLAAKNRHERVVRILITDGDVWLHNFDYRAALQQAAKFGHDDIFTDIARCEHCPEETAAIVRSIERNDLQALKILLSKIKNPLDFEIALRQTLALKNTEIQNEIATFITTPVDLALTVAIEVDNIELVRTILPRVDTFETFTKVFEYLEEKQSSAMTTKRGFWSSKDKFESSSNKIKGRFRGIVLALTQFYKPYGRNAEKEPELCMFAKLVKMTIQNFASSKDYQAFSACMQNISTTLGEFDDQPRWSTLNEMVLKTKQLGKEIQDELTQLDASFQLKPQKHN